ncbi:MAG: DUF3606 domain-containing protein [Pseudolabrys sp.]
MDIHPLKPDRSRVDLSSNALVRHWTKALGKSKAEIEVAIEKVGTDPGTVARQLGVEQKLSI